ncbi:hypothetical protein [Hymenobacter sp.]|jgi:hypothetical protein|uniref:hypothetical protein n=1 Tax=Hymenobacter sp. TaxID=1898978 RepID=UPI002ED8D7D0
MQCSNAKLQLGESLNDGRCKGVVDRNDSPSWSLALHPTGTNPQIFRFFTAEFEGNIGW